MRSQLRVNSWKNSTAPENTDMAGPAFTLSFSRSLFSVEGSLRWCYILYRGFKQKGKKFIHWNEGWYLATRPKKKVYWEWKVKCWSVCLSYVRTEWKYISLDVWMWWTEQFLPGFYLLIIFICRIWTFHQHCGLFCKRAGTLHYHQFSNAYFTCMKVFNSAWNTRDTYLEPRG